MASSNRENDQISMLGLDQEDIHRFGKMLGVMKLEIIPDFVSNIRQHGHRSSGTSPTLNLSNPCSTSCQVVYPPLCGSYHIVFPIEFADGVKWMLKIPANGYHFDSFAAAALISEARTMQMLRKQTSIPVPAVYAFDASSSNPLSVPYILMEKLSGRPLTHLWFNNEVPKTCLEHFRVKALQSLASSMVQLNKFTTTTSGSLIFDSDGIPIGIGGAKVMDGVAEFNKDKAPRIQSTDRNEAPSKTCVEDTRFNTLNVHKSTQAHADDRDDADIVYERGPFSDPKAYFMSNLERNDPAFRADAYDRGTDMCLRLFVEWAFADSRDLSRPFVLTHPDLDVQNILAADDGTITGLIDWDGAAAVPREIGCAQYPFWLMRDWVPSRYNYDTQNGQPYGDAGYGESSPAELASYRALYVRLMEAEIAKMTGGSNVATTLGTLPKDEAELTRRSLIMRSLDLSAGDPWAALSTVNHIIDHIEELTAPEWEDTDSDMDVLSSSLSACDSDSTIESDVDEENKEAKGPLTNEQVVNSMPVDLPTHSEESFGVKECTAPKAVTECSLMIRTEEKHVPPNSLELPQTGFKGLKVREPSKTPSASPGWICGLLRTGLNIVLQYLKTTAKVYYVPADVPVDATDVLAQVEAHNVETTAESGSVYDVNSDISQHAATIEPFQKVPIDDLEDNSSNEACVEQHRDSGLMKYTAVLPGTTSVEVTMKPEHIKTIPTIKSHNISLRKAELLQAVKMEKKAERKDHYPADKAAIKQELKVWEHIAFAVWYRGVPLKQLQMNSGRIIQWVVETLKPEEINEDDLTATAHHPRGAEATVTTAETVDDCAVDGPAMESDEEPKKVCREEDRLQNPKLKVDRPSAISKVTVAAVVSKNESGLDALPSSSKTSIIPTRNNFVPGNQFHIFEDNEDNEENQESSTKELTTTQPQASLQLAQNYRYSKVGDGSIATEKLAKTEGGNVLAIRRNFRRKSMIPIGEVATAFNPLGLSHSLLVFQSSLKNHPPPATVKASYSLRALCKSGISYITQTLFSNFEFEDDIECWSPDSSISSESSTEDGGNDVGDFESSATSLSDSEENKTTRINKDLNTGDTIITSDDTQARREPNTLYGQAGGNTTIEDHHKDQDGEGDNASSVESELPEFVDHGGFDRYTVCNLLGLEILDELRLLRLQDGFLKLLEMY